MHRIIINILFVLLCTNFLSSQVDFKQQLLDLELARYQSSNDSLKSQLAFQKMGLYIDSNAHELALMDEIKRVESKYLDSSQQIAFYWNASVAAYLMDESYLFTHYIVEYKRRSQDSAIHLRLLEYLVFHLIDPDRGKRAFSDLIDADSTLGCLSCLMEIQEFEIKNRWFKSNIGLVVPGLGLMLSGNILKGMTSVALNSLSFFAVRYLIQGSLYINAVAWGNNLFSKFYLGNLRLTEIMVNKREIQKRQRLANECEPFVQMSLMKYPIHFIR